MQDTYYGHRTYQLESGPFSENFKIVSTGVIFRGIFDRAHYEGKSDDGGVSRKALQSRILVSVLPDDLVKGLKIERVGDGVEYTFNKSGFDSEGVPVLWLV